MCEFCSKAYNVKINFFTVHKEIRCTVTDIFLLDIFLIDIFSFVGPMLVKKNETFFPNTGFYRHLPPAPLKDIATEFFFNIHQAALHFI